MIDRFSPKSGHLLTRDKRGDLPGPGQRIDLDRAPFVTQGLGPSGKPVRYYNFDVQSPVPATLYRIEGQPDVVDVIPGDAGYSDFFRIATVDVKGPITSAEQLRDLRVEATASIIDCPIVPDGTIGQAATARKLWYRGHAITCLEFGVPLTSTDRVPTSPIYVTFGAEGFRTEEGTPQTHNVVMSLPGDLDYSPLWDVHIYEPEAFDRVHDATTALAAPLKEHGPLVNCPIISQ